MSMIGDRRKLPFLLLNFMLSSVFAYVHFTKAHHIFDWQRFIALQGENPFQLRLLPYLLGHIINEVHVLSDKDIQTLFMVTDFMSVFASSLLVQSAACRDKASGYGLAFCSVLYWWQVFATFVISPVFNFYYPSDAISMAFVSIAMALIISNRSFWMIALVAIIAMFNRETAIFIPLLYAAYHFQTARLRYGQVILLVLACLAVKLGITGYFRAGSDSASFWNDQGQLRLFYNVAVFTLNKEYLKTLNMFFAFGGVWLFFLLKGDIEKNIMRMAYAFIPFFCIMMFVANLCEIRVFCEFIPVFTVVLIRKFGLTQQA